jgi:hypothetical protein
MHYCSFPLVAVPYHSLHRRHPSLAKVPHHSLHRASPYGHAASWWPGLGLPPRGDLICFSSFARHRRCDGNFIQARPEGQPAEALCTGPCQDRIVELM